jgi:hypothetical protein
MLLGTSAMPIELRPVFVDGRQKWVAIIGPFPWRTAKNSVLLSSDQEAALRVALDKSSSASIGPDESGYSKQGMLDCDAADEAPTAERVADAPVSAEAAALQRELAKLKGSFPDFGEPDEPAGDVDAPVMPPPEVAAENELLGTDWHAQHMKPRPSLKAIELARAAMGYEDTPMVNAARRITCQAVASAIQKELDRNARLAADLKATDSLWKRMQGTVDELRGRLRELHGQHAKLLGRVGELGHEQLQLGVRAQSLRGEFLYSSTSTCEAPPQEAPNER